eukprot:SAG11_NODE_26419_length_345_cov_1.276423_1_plen_41_part_01
MYTTWVENDNWKRIFCALIALDLVQYNLSWLYVNFGYVDLL